MAETIKGGIRVVIAAAAIPAILSGVGSQLDHAKRGRSCRMGVTVATGANQGVNMRNLDLRLGGYGDKKHAEASKKKRDASHPSKIG